MKRKILIPISLIILFTSSCSETLVDSPNTNATLDAEIATQVNILNLEATVNAQGTQIAILSQETPTPTAYPTPTKVTTPVPVDFKNEIASYFGWNPSELSVSTNYNDGQTSMGYYFMTSDAIYDGWWFAAMDSSEQWKITYISQGNASCDQVKWLHDRTTYPVYSNECVP